MEESLSHKPILKQSKIAYFPLEGLMDSFLLSNPHQNIHNIYTHIHPFSQSSPLPHSSTTRRKRKDSRNSSLCYSALLQ